MTYYALTALFFGLTLLVVTVSSLLWRGTGPLSESPNTPARIFLVLLRLAIGWHCLVEGLDKLHNPAWSSEAYLREAGGPLAGAYHWLAGDRVLDRLRITDKDQAPAALAADTDDYTEAFIAHYGLDDTQAERAREMARQAKSKAVTWLTSETESVQLINPLAPAVKADWTIPQRLTEYERLQSIVARDEEFLPSKDKTVLKHYTDARADVSNWRADLKKSYDAHWAGYKKSLHDIVLNAEQKNATAMPEPVALPLARWSLLEWSDRMVSWGLVVIGGGLLLGLFSRLASAAGAVLLLTFVLAMPPLPGWPESPRLEGHYLFINKTIIEVLALGALTFLPTGQWAGLDALVGVFWPRQRERELAVPSNVMVADHEPAEPVA
jgi:uncharacterized membrane protein YphA (DoxX/SURF4 family)